MKKNFFTKDELKKIRDVASLLTIVNKSANLSLFTESAYYLWRVFENFDGESIYEQD